MWIAAAGTVALVAAGYIVYKYMNGTKETKKQYQFTGQVPWDCSQEEKEKYARAWMEQYIKGVVIS